MLGYTVRNSNISAMSGVCDNKSWEGFPVSNDISYHLFSWTFRSRLASPLPCAILECFVETPPIFGSIYTSTIFILLCFLFYCF